VRELKIFIGFEPVETQDGELKVWGKADANPEVKGKETSVSLTQQLEISRISPIHVGGRLMSTETRNSPLWP